MSDQFFWFATRSAGILTWFSASISLLVGLLLSTRALGRRPTIPWLLDLHRYFAAMSVVFLAVHLFALWADSFVSFGPAELFVPGAATVPGLSRWSLALGVVAGWLLVIVQASSLIRTHLPSRFWHTLHLSSFGVVAAGAIHAIQTGSDTDNRYLIATGASVLTAIGLLTVIRIFSKLFDRKRRYDEAIVADDYYVDSGRSRDFDYEYEYEDAGRYDQEFLEDEADHFGQERADHDQLVPRVRRSQLIEPIDVEPYWTAPGEDRDPYPTDDSEHR